MDVLQFFPSDLAGGHAARALCSKDEKIERKDGEKKEIIVMLRPLGSVEKIKNLVRQVGNSRLRRQIFETAFFDFRSFSFIFNVTFL